MNRFQEYDTTLFGTIAVEADEEAVLSISILPSGAAPNTEAAPNFCTQLCIKQLREYFNGERKVFGFPYRLTGSDFENRVWTELLKVPYGKTISYKELAERTGTPQNIRLAANAARENRLPFLVPCHRIVGKENELFVSPAERERKETLLRMEAEPKTYTKFTYYEHQKASGLDHTNRISGRFLYESDGLLFETEPEQLLAGGKTHTFYNTMNFNGCSGFTLECICDAPPKTVPPLDTGAYTKDGLAYPPAPVAELSVTFYGGSKQFTSKAELISGQNTLHFDINDMKFTEAQMLAVTADAPIREVRLYRLNVLDPYFRYKGQRYFYEVTGGEAEDREHTLAVKINGSGSMESRVFPDTSQSVYNMMMPRRNTVFMVLKNNSDAKSLKLYYRTAGHPEYCEENSVSVRLVKAPEYHAYYFNLSATPGCEGRLLQWKLVWDGSGELIFREYSFEEEEKITESAGSITSCIARDGFVTVKGYLDTAYTNQNSGVISVYATTMADENELPDTKEPIASVTLQQAIDDSESDGRRGTLQFTLREIPFKKGPITRLSFQFAAYLTVNGKTIPIGRRFYIENYMDYDNNPYEFSLPDYRVRVTDAPFGAKGDACTDDTDAIQKAIDQVWKQGGGTVVIPGLTEAERLQPDARYGKRYRVTNLLLRSRVELHLEAGTILWQSPIYTDYKYVPTYGHDHGIPHINWTHCLHVANLPTLQCEYSEYVKITGFGKIRSVDTGAEEGVSMSAYSTGCPDRIHQIPIGFYEVKHIELRDFELVRTNNYHIGLYGCSYIYAANLKLHEVRCVSGDGFGLSKGTHHVVLNRNFLQSNDDGVVLSGCYFDPRGLVWWKSRRGIHGGTRHVKIAHSYLNSGGGKALAFIPWGTCDSNYEMQEISDITAYDNYLCCANPVGAWADNPYNGKHPFDNSETDDYSPVKSVRIFNNLYEGECSLGPIRATDLISDCGIYAANQFQNQNFRISAQPNLSNWSYKKNKNSASVSVRSLDGTICGVLRYFKEGDVSLYQGLHLAAGIHSFEAELLTGETGAYLFVQNIRTGEILAERHVAAESEYRRIAVTFTLTEDTDIYAGVRHPADMTSDDEYTAIRHMNMKSIEA